MLFLSLAFFLFLPSSLNAADCSTCSPALQADVNACQANEAICINDFIDPDTCADRRETCIRSANSAFQNCTATCTTPPETTPQPALPATQSAPTSPDSDRVTLDDIVREGLINAGISDECKTTGVCTFDDMLQIIVNISTVILGLIGAIMLVVFIMGGVTWLTSDGNQAKIQKGLDTIRDAIIGLIIVLGAYTLVNVTIRVLTQEGNENIFDGNSTIEDSVGNATGMDFQQNTNE